MTRMNVGGNNLSKTVLIGPDGQGQRYQTSLGQPLTTPQEVGLLWWFIQSKVDYGILMALEKTNKKTEVDCLICFSDSLTVLCRWLLHVY